MVDIAIRHTEELVDKFRSVWFDDKYKYWNYDNYYEDWKPGENTWNVHEYAILNSSGEVIGFVGYSVNRSSEYATNLNIINFTDDKCCFGIDAMRIIRDVFEKFHFRKLCFSVVVGNPIEPKYDCLVCKFGGRIVGVREKHVRLIDNKLYDEKMYEILEEHYVNRRDKDAEI